MAAERQRAEGGRLGDGMVIAASVRARIFGLTLLRLRADIVVTPTPARVAIDARLREPRERSSAAAVATTNGRIGGSLPEVARALEANSAVLAKSRRGMP